MPSLTAIASVFLFLFISSGSFGQDQGYDLDASFCGYPGNDHLTTLEYSKEMIDNCDLAIVPDDHRLKVKGFSLTLVPWVRSEPVTGIEIQGDRIPDSYRTQIKDKTRSIIIEQIVATAFDGSRVMLKPMVVRISSR